jgi:putative FmdB family regulatory protein
MPIYEYRCNACGHEMEAIQKLSDPPLVDCPECGSQGMEKLVSAAGFRLKGGGWYETDFKGGKKKNLHDTGSKKTESKSTAKEK